MQLKEAVTKLNDPDRAVRDAAMAVVLTARANAVPALVDALKMPGAPVAKIALLLAALKARDGVRPMADLLAKGVLDFDARAVVARAFGELVDGRDAFDDSVKRGVLQLSKDPHGTTRQLTVKALQSIGDVDCEARLAEMAVVDTDAGAKKAAQESLAALRASRPPPEPVRAGSPSSPATNADGGMHLDFEAALAQQQKSGPLLSVPTGPFAPLVLRLRDPRWAMRNAAVEEAVQAGKAVVPTLVEVLSEPHAGAKIGAAQALARIQAPDAAQALLDVVIAEPHSDDEKQLRPIALKALACSITGTEEGFAKPLLPLVRDADPFVRAGALLCLGRLADRVGARAATVALTDPHDHVKEAAAVALSEGAREDDQDLVLPLLAVLAGMPSPTVAVRKAILLALARIHVDDPAIGLRLRHRVRPGVLGMTSSLRRTAIAVLERCYTADDPPPTAIIDDVLGRLADDHPEVRLLAASFLAQHLEAGITGAVEQLEDALDREEKTVSLLCLEALKRHDTAKAKLALEAAADDPDEAVAARAKELLVGFEPKTEEWLAAPPPEPVAEAAPVEAAPAEAAPPDAAPAEAPPTSRRVRVARGGGDVVEAKDSSAAAPVSAEPIVDTRRLADRLRALQSAGQSGDPAARARVFDAFVSSSAPSSTDGARTPSGRLKDELASLNGLSDEEKRARRDAILNQF